jgi:hypothetical protein
MPELPLDAAGRRRSPATLRGFHAGRPSRNKGLRDPADSRSVEELVAVMWIAGASVHGGRLRGLWRAGLRIHVVTGPTRGRHLSSAAARGAAASGRPSWRATASLRAARHPHAVEIAREGVPLMVIPASGRTHQHRDPIDLAGGRAELA